MAAAKKAYTITAELEGGVRVETRRQSASAMCLADRWAAEGGQNVALIDVNGVVHSREQFRRALWNARRPRWN